MLKGSLSPQGMLSGSLAARGSLAGALSAGRAAIPPYDGATVFTPSETAQTVPTGGHALSEDIVIEPIPTSYGRIEQRGSALYVY